MEQKFMKAYMTATSGWRDFTHLSGTELIEGVVAELNQHAITEAESLTADPTTTWAEIPAQQSLEIEEIELSMVKLLEQLPVFQGQDLEDCTNDFSEKLYESTHTEENLSDFFTTITKNLCNQFGLMICYHYYRLSEMETDIIDLEDRFMVDHETVKKYKNVKEAMELAPPGTFIRYYPGPEC